MLEIKNLTKSFGEKELYKNVNLITIKLVLLA